MSILRVINMNMLSFGGKSYRCAVGKSGFSADKKEGDGATPIGAYPLRECWYRADKIAAPVTSLPLTVIRQDDGWCDAPNHPLYNRAVKRPFAASHEHLWREDDVYDIVIPLGYNDAPVAPGKGSAIFLHVAKPGYVPTEGCVALARADLLELLPRFTPDTTIVIGG